MKSAKARMLRLSALRGLTCEFYDIALSAFVICYFLKWRAFSPDLWGHANMN
jgi:hypothetical protein